jgi:hypothetical protein
MLFQEMGNCACVGEGGGDQAMEGNGSMDCLHKDVVVMFEHNGGKGMGRSQDSL